MVCFYELLEKEEEKIQADERAKVLSEITKEDCPIDSIPTKLYADGFNDGYEQGKADRDKEITEHNVFFSNKPIEDIVLEARADERAKILGLVNALIKTRLIDNLALDNATKYGNKNAKQQANSYATVMKYEIADCVEDLLDDLERLKEQK